MHARTDTSARRRGSRPGRFRSWIAVLAAAVLVLSPLPALAVPGGPEVAPGELAVQLTVPDGYEAPSDMDAEPDLSGISVYLWAVGSESSPVDFGNRTDADGVVRFTGLNPGRYGLSIGNVRGSDLGGGVWTDDGWGPNAADGVTVGADGRGIVVPLRVLPVVRGTVRDEGGAPVAGAVVNDNGVSGADGRFAATVDPTSATVCVTAPEGSGLVDGCWVADDRTATHGAMPVSLDIVDGVPSPAEITVRLASGGSIRGIITDPDGAPAAGVGVSASGFGFAQTVTEADGSYALGGLAPGSYRVTVASSAPYGAGGWITADGGVGEWSDALEVVVTAGAATSGVDARQMLGGAIAGTLEGVPAGDAVAVNHRNASGGSTTLVPAGQTDFLLPGLRPDTWLLSFSPNATAPSYALPATSAEVSPGVTTPVTVTAVRAGGITGRVGGLSPHGTAIVTAYATGGDSRSTSATASGNGEAAFSLDGLAPGEWVVTATEWSTNRTISSAPLTVAPDASTDAGLLIVDDDVSIRLSIYDQETSQPIPGASAYAVPLEAEGVVVSGVTDDAGDVVLRVAPGGYQITVTAPGYAGGSLEVWPYSGELYAPLGLARQGALEVTATADGQPYAWGPLEVRSLDEQQAWSGQTDGDGVAHFDVPDGEYVAVLPTAVSTGSEVAWDGASRSAPFGVAGPTAVSADFGSGMQLDIEVRDADGEIVPEASVTVYALDAHAATTFGADEEGRLTLWRLPAGTYTVSAGIDGTEVFLGGARTAEQAETVVLSAEAPHAAVALQPDDSSARVISGLVTDAHGDPVAGENVRIALQDAEGGEWDSVVVATGADGEYRARVPLTDTYVVNAAYGPASVYEPQTVTLQWLTGDERVDFSLDEGVSRSGVVLGGTAEDPTGESDPVPLAGATVFVQGTDFVREAVTDEDGAYVLTGLRDGWVHQAWYSGGGAYVDDSRQLVDGDTVVLELGGYVEVEVTAGDEDVYGTVTFIPQDRWDVAISSYGVSSGGPSTTGPLPAGRYRASIEVEGWAPQLAVVDVVAGETGELAFALERAASLTGTVTVAGVPFGMLELLAVRDGETVAISGTDASGAFAMPMVPAGELELVAKWEGAVVGSQTVVAVADETSPADVLLDPATAPALTRVELSGRGEDAPRYEGWITFTGDEGVLDYYASDGVAQIVGGPAIGDAVLSVQAAGPYLGGLVAADGSMVDADGAPFSYGGTVHQRIAVTLDRPGAVSGTVVDAHGTPLPGARVQLGQTVLTTDANGWFRFVPVRPGSPVVSVQESDVHRGAAVTIAALAEDEWREIEIAVDAWGRAIVTVLDADDQPIEGAEVALTSDEAPAIFAATGEDGVVTVDGLRPDATYRIQVLREGFLPAWVGGDDDPTPITVDLNGTVSLTQRLLRAGTLGLDLTYETEPGAGEILQADLLDPVTGDIVRTHTVAPAALGDDPWNLEGIAPGSYLVRLSSPFFQTVLLSADGTTTDPAAASPVTFTGDGSAITRAAHLERAWTGSAVRIEVAGDTVYGTAPAVDITVSVDDPGRAEALEATVWVDDEFYSDAPVPGDGGTFTVHLVDDLPVGTHRVRVDVASSGAVRGSTDEAEIVIVPVQPGIVLDVPAEAYAGRPVVIGVLANAPVSLDGATVDVRVGDDTFTVTLDGDRAQLRLSDGLAAGEYDISAVLRATAVSAETADASALSVVKAPSEITASVVDASVPYAGAVEIDVTAWTATGEFEGAFVVLDAAQRELARADAAASAALRFDAAEVGSGTHTLTVRFAGSDRIAASATEIVVSVEGRLTTTEVSAPATAVYGEEVAVTVTVAAPGGGTPEGEVTVSLAGATATGTLEDGAAVVRLRAASAGTHAVSAAYAGSGRFDASASSAVDLVVTPAAARVDVTMPGDGRFGTSSTVGVSVAAETGPAASGTVRLLLDDEEVDRADLHAGSATLDLPAQVSLGAHDVQVAYDGSADVTAAESAVRTWRMRTGPPVVDVTVDETLVPLGDDPATVSLAVTAAGDGTTPLTYRVLWGDGSPALTGTYTETLALTHDYARTGRFVIRVEVESADDRDAYITARTRTVTVYADQPLVAHPGDPQAAVAGANVVFDARNSTPYAAIDRVVWDFGDGYTATGWQAAHAYADPGEYTVSLTVHQGTASATATTTVSVAEVPTVDGVAVTVTTGGALLRGATVVYVTPGGARVQGTTGDDGVALLHGLPDGPQPVYVTAGGYLPAVGEVTVTGGDGATTVDLQSGEIAATTLEHRPLVLEEIIERGIDVQNPENQNIFLAEIQLAVVPDDDEEQQPIVDIVYDDTTRRVWIDSDQGEPGETGWIFGDYIYEPRVIGVGDVRAVQWMIIPVKGSWLKEFFDVRLVVQNLASSAFTFENGQAELILPDGLSLAPTGTPQSLVANVPDVRGGETVGVSWTVRGDAAGGYHLSAAYSATLEPSGQRIDATAAADRMLIVHGALAVDWSVTADPRANANDPYRVTLTMRNITDPATGVPVYGAGFEISPGAGYVLAPAYPYSGVVKRLLPGQSQDFEFVFHTLETGDVNVSDPQWAISRIVPTGGDVQPINWGITLHPENTPVADATTAWLQGEEGDGVGLDLALAWELIDEATSYSVWGRASLTEGEWVPVTGQPLDGLEDARVLSAQEVADLDYYTVITHFADGSTAVRHPIVTEVEVPTYFEPDPDYVVDSRSSMTLGGNCFDVLTIGVPGSDQYGNLGNEVAVVSDTILNELNDAGAGERRSIRSVYLQYDAAAIPIVTPEVSINAYGLSIQSGVDKLRELLEVRAAQCANEKVVLAGYSQGALVISQLLDDLGDAGEAEELLPVERVGGIYLISNPANHPSNGGTRLGTSPFATGITLGGTAKLTEDGLTAGSLHTIPAHLQPLTVSLCDRGDLVCAFTEIAAAGATAGFVSGPIVGTVVTAVAGYAGLHIHTGYPDRVLAYATMVGMGVIAADRLLKVAVPVPPDGESPRADTVYAEIRTPADVPFESDPIALKPLVGTDATWASAGDCTDIALAVGTLTDDGYAAVVGGVAPAGYHECVLRVTGAETTGTQDVRIAVRSGWAADAAGIEALPLSGPEHRMRAYSARVVDGEGAPVAGVPVTFTLTGPATFSGGKEATVPTAEDGVAVAPLPAAVRGEGGVLSAVASVPGLADAALPGQEIETGLPDGITVKMTPVFDRQERRSAIDVEVRNTTDSDALVTVMNPAVVAGLGRTVSATVSAGGTETLRSFAPATVVEPGVLRVRAVLQGTELGEWLEYGAYDPYGVTVSASVTPAESVYGSTVRVSGEIDSDAGDVPGGTVSLEVDGTVVDTATPVGGAVSFTFAPGGGEHTARLLYTGERSTTSNSVTFTVTRAATTSQLETGTDPVASGATHPVTVEVRGTGIAVGDTVRIRAGAADVATATVAEGDLTGSGARLTIPIDTTDLAAGAHELVAVYDGNGNAAGSSSAARPLVVTVATTLTATVDEVDAGAAGEVEVVVTVADRVPGEPVGGTVTVSAPGWDAALTADVVDGVARVPLPARGAGELALTITYSGTGVYAAAATTASAVVRPAATTTTLTLTPDAVTYGDAVTARVSVAAASGLPVAGTVALHAADTDGAPLGDALAVAAVADGAATLVLARPGVGTGPLVAVFTAATGDIAGSRSAATELAVTPLRPEVTVALGAATVVFGDEITGSVAASALGAPVDGSVTAAVGGTSATAEADGRGWRFRLPTTGLPAGTHTVAVTFTPDSADHTAVTVARTVTVEPVAAALTAVFARSTIAIGDSAALEISLPQAPGATVALTWPGGARTVTLDGAGRGSAEIADLPVGTHTVTATFTGTGTVSGATAGATVEVTALSGAVTASAAAVRYGLDTPAITVGFAGLEAGADIPTGTVALRRGDATVATAALTDGGATLTLATPPVGAHEYTVAYSGDARYAASATSVTLVVTAGTPTITVDWPGAQTFGAVAGDVVATVMLGTSAAPAADVTLLADGVVVGTNTLTGGQARLALPAGLAAGAHALVVRYAGTADVVAAEASGTVVVTPAATTTALTVPGRAAFGTAVSAQIAVTGATTGAVEVVVGGRTFGGTLAGGEATVSIDTVLLPAGDLVVAAHYLGDDDHAPSTVSAPLTIDAVASTTTVAPRGTAVAGGLMELAVTVAAGAVPVSGTVTATAEGAPALTGAVVRSGDGFGVVLVVPDTIADGTYRYTVAYRGANGILPSDAQAGAFTISRESLPEGVEVVPETEVTEAGQPQTLEFRGLEPGTVIHVYLHSDPVYLGSAVADARGVAVLTFTVPAELVPGLHRVEARTPTGVLSTFLTVEPAPAEEPGGSSGGESAGSGGSGSAGPVASGSGSGPGTVSGSGAVSGSGSGRGGPAASGSAASGSAGAVSTDGDAAPADAATDSGGSDAGIAEDTAGDAAENAPQTDAEETGDAVSAGAPADAGAPVAVWVGIGILLLLLVAVVAVVLWRRRSIRA